MYKYLIKNPSKSPLLPKTNYQHVTFTMPDVLWDFFWCNRQLLHLIPAIAAGVLKDLAAKKNLIVGIFLMLHTFGRDLKRNVHIHLSVTLGGLTLDLKQWKNTSQPCQKSSAPYPE